MKKLSKTQDLLQHIYVFYKCKSMAEAQKKYRELYEDEELDPKRAEALISQA